MSTRARSNARVVLDTNVALSGIFFGGVPGRILGAWQVGHLTLQTARQSRNTCRSMHGELDVEQGSVAITLCEMPCRRAWRRTCYFSVKQDRCRAQVHEPVVSRTSIPRFRNSAMYAFAGMHSSGVHTPGGVTCPLACICPVIDNE